MGKIFKIIIGLIGTIVLLVIVGVVVFAIMLTGGEIQTPEYVLEDETSSSSYISYAIGESIKDTENTNIIDITLDEKELNYLLNAMLRESKAEIDTAPLEIDYIYTTIDEESGLNVFIPARVFFIRTVVKTAVKITQIDQEITIELVDLKIGRISFASKLAKKVMGINTIETEIKKTLANNGVEAEVDLENFTFTITTSQLQNIILDALKEDDNVDLYKTVFSMFFMEDNVININFGLDNKAGITLNLQKMGYNESNDGEDDIDYDISSIVAKAETMLNNKALSEKDLAAAFRYLLIGYDRIKDEELVVINKIDFSSIGITNRSNYQGIIPQEEFAMVDVFNSITLADLLANPGWFTVRITEADLNKIFLGMDLVGTAFAFPYLEAEVYHVSYIVLSSFYVDIFNDMIEIKLVLDVNGKETIIKTTFTGTKNQDLLIELDFTELNLGQIAGTEADRTNILTYLSGVLENETWLEFDIPNKKVVFNFAGMITANELLQDVIVESGTKETQFIGASLVAEGYIELKMEISLIP
ncbi:MAG: hypothetical protein WC929_03935 [Bacilli bacterium]|jgi:hypothetical protein|nr:hypothetical protein [Bacilli bacterium]